MGFNSIPKGVALCVAFFLFHSSYLFADVSVSFGSLAQKINYQEKEPAGEILNKESGLLPGFYFDSRFDFDKVSVNSVVRFVQAEIDYNGQTQAGIPLITTTQTLRSEYGVGIAYRLADWFELSAGYSQYFWDREINGSNISLPLDEYYEWSKVKLGVGVTLFESARDRLGLTVEYGEMFDGQLEVNLSSLGFGRPIVELEGRYSSLVGFVYHYDVSSSLSIEMNASYEQISFEQSDSVSASNGVNVIEIREPASRTNISTLGIGLNYKL